METNEQINNDKPVDKPIENLSQLLTSEPPPAGLEEKKVEASPAQPQSVDTKIIPMPGETTLLSDEDLLEPPPAPAAKKEDILPPSTPQASPGPEPKKKPGRPVGSKNKPADFSDIQQMQQSQVDYQLMAGMLFDMSTGILATSLGPEWLPRVNPQFLPEQQEREVMVGAIKTYLASKQVKDIPPGLMLTFMVVAYSAPRLQAPPTKEKLKFGITWFKIKVSGFFKRRRQAPPILTGKTP